MESCLSRSAGEAGELQVLGARCYRYFFFTVPLSQQETYPQGSRGAMASVSPLYLGLTLAHTHLQRKVLSRPRAAGGPDLARREMQAQKPALPPACGQGMGAFLGPQCGPRQRDEDKYCNYGDKCRVTLRPCGQGGSDPKLQGQDGASKLVSPLGSFQKHKHSSLGVPP